MGTVQNTAASAGLAREHGGCGATAKSESSHRRAGRFAMTRGGNPSFERAMDERRAGNAARSAATGPVPDDVGAARGAPRLRAAIRARPLGGALA